MPKRIANLYRQSQKGGNPNPFLVEGIVICSIHFASRRASEVRAIQWNLAVIDEAHKLRNAYRQSKVQSCVI
jgi:superfamily II DNA or RNA helicase